MMPQGKFAYILYTDVDKKFDSVNLKKAIYPIDVQN